MTKAVSHNSAPLWVALIPIVVLIVLLVVNVRIYADNASYGPNQIALLLSAATAAVLGFCLRQKFEDMLAGIIRSLESAMSAMLLLLLIGSLTGTWMISGVVPAMVYYGLDLLNPSIFLAATVIICSVVSVATGSSWSTIATVGVALLGIGDALGFSSAITAGAIISGAYFGDKLSPLSDTTNLAAAMAGSDLIEHIRYMLWTTVPSILITIVFFTLIGFFGDLGSQTTDTGLLKSAIADRFYITPWLFLVPAAVLGLVVLRMHAISALFCGVILGAVFAVIFQPEMIRQLSGQPTKQVEDEEGTVVEKPAPFYQHAYVTIVNAMADETKAVPDDELKSWEEALAALTQTEDSAGEAATDATSEAESEASKTRLESQLAAASLMKGKGMIGMLNTIWLIITAMCFGGVMEACGFLRRITEPLIRLARTDGSLIATTAGSCLFVNATASDQYLAIVVPGRMFRETFGERGLQAKVLSRTLEDSGTVTSVLVPWNTCGAAQQGVLGVSVLDFAPWCIFNIVSPLMTMAYGFLGIRIARKEPNSAKSDGTES